MEDVAREAGVSRALVSIVYRGVDGASEQTRRRVFEAGERLGYRRNHLASRLASRTTRSLGVLVFDFRNELSSAVFAGVQAEADRLGLGVVVGVSDPSGERDQRTVNELLEARVDALVLISATLSGSAIRALGEQIPVVSATRLVNGVDSVVVDERRAAQLVVDHLAGAGRTEILHLAPPWRPSARIDGYERAMEAHALTPWVVDVGYGLDEARTAVADLLAGSRRPDAVFANNDVAAYAALDGCLAAGLRVPEDVAVVGFDNLPLSDVAPLALTSIDQQPRELGRLAVRLATERLDEPGLAPRREVLAPRLVVRRSSGG